MSVIVNVDEYDTVHSISVIIKLGLDQDGLPRIIWSYSGQAGHLVRMYILC